VFDLKKVWRGEIDLTITFWVWGVLVANVLFDVLLGVLIAATENQFLMLLHRIFVVAVNAFVVVAIWRSAGNYKGPPVWPLLARLMCVANVVVYGLTAFGVFDATD
jgi:hypothetical protein